MTAQTAQKFLGPDDKSNIGIKPEGEPDKMKEETAAKLEEQKLQVELVRKEKEKQDRLQKEEQDRLQKEQKEAFEIEN